MERQTVLAFVAAAALGGYLVGRSAPVDKTLMVQGLLRQSARWATAAEQDRNPMIRVLHANYGAGFLWALKGIASDTEIRRLGGVDARQFEEAIVGQQDAATKAMAAVCPKYAPPASYLTRIAGEGV